MVDTNDSNSEGSQPNNELVESSSNFGNNNLNNHGHDFLSNDVMACDVTSPLLEVDPKLMEAEEIRAQQLNNLEEEKKKQKQERILQKQIEELGEKKLREERLKRLWSLLSKSQFYSKFIFERIDSQLQSNGEEKKDNPLSDVVEEENTSESSEESNPVARKRKVGTSDADKKSKKNRKKPSSNIQIPQVLENEKSDEAELDQPSSNIQQPQLLSGAVLRQYQLDGFNWLRVLYENGVNGMLADEMGLGKTVQTIALLCHLVEKGVKGPFLVVAPLSTLCNWCNEIKMFAPQLPYVLFHGNEDVRREKMKLFNKTSPVTVTLPDGSSVTHNVCPIVVTSYEIAILSHRLLSPYQWRYLAVDEGHRIKNYECRLAKCLKNYKCPSRLLLTGTPLQNSLAELWSLLNFLLPMVFDSLDVFESWFDVTNMANDDAELRIVKQEEESRIISTLHQILSPFLLRRMKSDVDLQLPAKREILVYAHMTQLQLTLYKATLDHDMAVFKEQEGTVEEVTYDSKGRPIRRCATQGAGRVKALLDGMHLDSPVGLDRFLAALQLFQPTSDGLPEKETKSKLRVRLQNRMMQCRRVVNHPYLISYPLTPDGQYKVDEELVSSCGKLQVLDQLLQELYSRGHKVLLFSQMTKLLDILHDYLTLRPQYNYLRLDGNVSLEDRQADIDSFNKDSDVFLFLLSTRAGSLGINLTAADTVIIYDSDWNPQQDLQAQDRCHRIGQTKPVLVLRLVTAASIDEKIVERANSKRCLEKLIMKAGRFKQVKDREEENFIDRDELLTLLEERDHHSVYGSDKATNQVFSKKELDRILDRSDMIHPVSDTEDNNNNKKNKSKPNKKRPLQPSRAQSRADREKKRDVFMVLS